MVPTVKHGEIGVMAWGWFQYDWIVGNGDSAPVVAELDGVVSGDSKACGV
jgi:hypothetical protein